MTIERTVGFALLVNMIMLTTMMMLMMKIIVVGVVFDGVVVWCL